MRGLLIFGIGGGQHFKARLRLAALTQLFWLVDSSSAIAADDLMMHLRPKRNHYRTAYQHLEVQNYIYGQCLSSSRGWLWHE